MKNRARIFHKIISVISGLSLVFQSILPASVLPLLFATPAYAQEATVSADTQTPTPTNSETPTQTPTETPAETPTETPSSTPTEIPTPTIIDTITPTPEELQPTPTEVTQPTETAPPTQGQILDGVATEAPTPTITPEQPKINGHVNAQILENKNASSINQLDLDAGNITTSATLVTDKADYAPTDTALISGTGFLGGHTYSIHISSNDPPATSTTASVTTDAHGDFLYAYQLDGNYRPNYSVVVFDGSTIVATTTFTDSGISVTPTSGLTGSAVAVSGSGFHSGDSITIKFNTVTQTTSGSCTVSGNSFGPCNFTIPVIANGPYTVSANDTHSNTFSTTFTVTSTPTPTPTPTPAPGSFGSMTSPGIACMADQPNQNGLVCTANDTALSSATIISINDDGCKFPGDTVNFTASWQISTNATSRYNMGLWFATAGQSSAMHGTCSTSTLPSSPSPFFSSKAGDTCGDMSSSGPGTITLTMTAICNPDVNGLLKLPYCTSWQQNDNSTCTNPSQTVPGTGSKCECADGSTIPISVPKSSIEVVKVLSPNTDLGKFNLQINGQTATGAANIGDGGDTGNVGVSSGTNTIGETQGTNTLLSNYTSVVSCKDKANNNPVATTGSNPWTLTTAVGQNILCTITNTRVNNASITIIKDAQPNDAQDFSFTTTGTGLSSFSLDDDADATLSNTKVFSNLASGTYSVAETAVSGWTQKSATCSDGSPVSAISLASGENVTCTFTNTRDTGKLELQKDFVGTPQNVTIAIGTTEGGSQIDSDTISTDGTDGEHTLPTGTYFVSESLTNTNNYTSGLSCYNDSDKSVHSVNTATGAVSIGSGDDVVCVFTNTRNQGTIELTKAWSGTAGQTTLQIGTSAGGTQIAIQQTGVNGAAPLTTGTTTVDTGTYYVSETGGLTDYAPALSCTDNGQPMTPGANNDVTVLTGHAVVCTFTNTRNTGSLVVHKKVDTDGDGIFETSDPQTFTWSLDGTGTNAMGATVSNINTGSHSVNENTVPNYHFVGWYNTSDTSKTCANTTNTTLPATVTIATGQTTNITLCNARDTGTLRVLKNVDINGDGDYTDQGETGATDWKWQYNAGGDHNTGDAAITVPTGDYALTESNKTNFHFVNLACTGGTLTNNSVAVTKGATVVCTFTNAIDLGTIILKKVMVGGTDSFEFTGSPSGTINTNNGTITVNNVAPGSYTSTESTKSGWVLDSISCNDGQSTTPSTVNKDARSATFKVDPGETVTCTFTNSKLPTLSIYKVCNPTGDTGTFNLQIDGNNVTTGTVCGGWTNGPVEVSIGGHTVGETGAGANLANYTAAITGDCATDGTITLAAGENKSCTITNTRNTGSVKVNKLEDTDGNGSYETTNSAHFTWSLDGSGTNAMGASVAGVTTGVNHSVDESTNADYTFVGWFFGSPTSTQYSCTHLPDATANHHLPATVTTKLNDTTEITICNKRKTGQVIVHKDVQGPNGEDVTDTSYSFGVSLDGAADQTITDGGTVTYNNVPTGTHRITEPTVDSHYDLYGISETAGTSGHTNGLDVTVSWDTTTNVYVTNRQHTGTITVNKEVDRNGDGTFEETNPSDFTWTVDDAGSRVMGASDSSIIPGNHTIGENNPSDYHFVGWFPTGYQDFSCTNLPRDTENTNYHALPIHVNVGPGGTSDFTLCNARDTGRLLVNKIADTDGDGKYDAENPQDFKWGTQSAVLSATDMGTSQTLTTGTYNVYENNVPSYEFTGWFPGGLDNRYSCTNLPEGEQYTQLPTDLSVTTDETTEITICNKLLNPILTITKENNTGGATKHPSDSVLFTLTVTATQSAAYNVKVTDLPAGGFVPRDGTYTANSSVRGDIMGVVGNPGYHSPGVWNLGNMQKDEVVTITYLADIVGNEQPGTYFDLAWGTGCKTNTNCSDVLANSTNPGIVTDSFVGTEVRVATDQQTGVGVTTTGEVLGASTELPATGASSAWIMIALGLIGSGLSLGVIGIIRRRHYDNLLIIALSFLFAGRVFAASPLVAQMEAPRTPTNQTDIAINVVVLDQNQVPSISVQCYWRKDGGAWSGLGSAHTVIPGGNNTANCQTTANEINNDGSTYEFYAIADDGATTATTKTVSVVYTRSSPGTPTNFSKDKTSCTYKISFHTANDSGKTAKVEIYRSANNSFPLDGSTKIGEVSVGSNSDASYNDTPPDCNTAYYYGARAFDAAGNGSGAVGESQPTVITTTTTTKTGASGASGVQGAIPAGNNGNVLGAVNTASEGPTGASGAVLGEATPSAIPTPTPAPKATRTTPWLIGGGILVALFVVWQANRKKST